MTTTARATVQHDDERMRVTRWDFAPGESTGRHTHGYDYVVVPVTDGHTAAITADGNSTASTLKAGMSYARPAGGEHEVINTGDTPLVFVEIESK